MLYITNQTTCSLSLTLQFKHGSLYVSIDIAVWRMSEVLNNQSLIKSDDTIASYCEQGHILQNQN